MSHLDRCTVLITGAGGFLGGAVVRALLPRAGHVRALLGPPGTAVRLPRGVEAACAEIDDRAALGALVKGASVVVHLAGPPSVPASFEQPGEYARIHVTGTATVLEASVRAEVERVVYVSSAEVYSRPPPPEETGPGEPVPGRCRITEDERLSARSPYAAAKIGAEQLIQGYFRAMGGEAVVLRPFSLYGAGSPGASLFGTVVRQARKEAAIEVADLRPERDYCAVDDAAEAVARACVCGNGVFNVGTGRATSVAELCALALRAAGRDVPVRELPGRRRPRALEALHLVGDPSRARHELGWSATTSLEAGLERAIREMH